MTYIDVLSLNEGDLVQSIRTKEFRIVIKLRKPQVSPVWTKAILKNPISGKSNGWVTRSEMEHNWDKLPANSEIAKNLYGK